MQLGELTTDRAKRILVVTPWFPNRRSAWPFPFIADSCTALAGNGRRVHVIVARPFVPRFLVKKSSLLVSGNIDTGDFGDLESLDEIHYPSVPRNLVPWLSNRLLDARVGLFANRKTWAEPPDIVHAHTEGMAPVAVRVGQRLRVPVIVTIHGLNTDSSYLQTPRQKARFAGALAAADRVVLVGEPLRGFFSNYIGRSDHLRMVPNGVAVPNTPPVQVFTRPGPVRLISVANLHEGKGIDLTLVALGKLASEGCRDWSYRIIGEGAERAKLMRMARDLEIADRLTFVGAVPHAAVQEALSAADVFVLPSYREAFGIAYLEAMAAGLLTIGVEGQGPCQFIRHGETGLLVPPRDAEALAEQLKSVLNGDVSWKRQIAAAGCLAARCGYSWDAHARALAGVFDEAVKDRRSL